MTRLKALLAALLLVLSPVLSAQAQAEARLALVVGNGAYSGITSLSNPVNDAVLVADALEGIGFDVTLVTEARRDDLIRAISDFGRRLREAGEDATGLFYYAGHGVQSFGTNFLLPVDVEVADAADLSLVGVPAEAVLRQMFSARNQTNIVILDACRNNPFETVPDLADNGLAEMKAPTGTYLAYSTAPGDVAVDGAGSNSPFTEAFARRIPTPGMPIEALFKQVRVDVLAATRGQQTPWDTSSLTVDFQFVPAVLPSPEEIRLRQLWDSVRLSRDPVQVLLFLRANPDTIFTQEARALLSELMAEEIDTAAAAPPPVARAAPAPVDPAEAERALIETARSSGLAADYEAYLAAYPEGAFAELARFELKVIAENGQRTDPIADPPPPPVAAAVPEVAIAGLAASLTFTTPIGGGDPAIATRSIAELIEGSPLFPPIEGLPDAIWKDQNCTACHEWKQDNLCDQARTYVADRTRAISKQHPYGGSFKEALRVWAESGCN